MKSALVSIGGEGRSGKKYNILDEYSPLNYLGLQYVGGALEKSGNQVRIIDAATRQLNDKEILSEIKSYGPSFIGFSPLFNTRCRIKGLTEKLKELMPEIYICLGGHDVTWDILDNPNRYQKADFVIRGEGEKAVVELIERIQKNKSLKGLSGLCYRDKTDLYLTDTFADKPDLSKTSPILDFSMDITAIDTSRGCLPEKGGCKFCTTPQFFKKPWTPYPLEQVLERIERLADRGIKKFSINDDNFLGFSREYVKRADKIIDKIKECNGIITYSLIHEIPVIIAKKEGYLEKWSGTLIRTLLGTETPCKKYLDIYGKKSNRPERSLEAIRALKDANVCVQVGLIPFNPYTKLEDFKNGYIKWLSDIDETAYWLNFSHYLRPYPGTPIKQKIIDDGLWIGEPEEELDPHTIFGYKFLDSRVEQLARGMLKIAKNDEIANHDQLNNLIYLYLADKGLAKYVVSYADREIPNDTNSELFKLAQQYKQSRKEIGAINCEYFSRFLKLAEEGWNEKIYDSLAQQYTNLIGEKSSLIQVLYQAAKEAYPLGERK